VKLFSLYVTLALFALIVSCPNMEEIMPLVSEQGVGIPGHELETVFNKFTWSTKIKTGTGGIGLGLAICKQIVEEYGVKYGLKIKKMVGGALFCFIFPLKG